MKQEDREARQRVTDKIRQEVSRKKNRLVEERMRAIQKELENNLQRGETETREAPQECSPSRDEQQKIEDIELLRVLQFKSQQTQKQQDLLRLQLSEAEKTILSLKELLEKERARGRELEVQFVQRERQQLGDQKSEFEQRIRQNLKAIEELQGQRKQLTQFLQMAQTELLAEKERGRKAGEHLQEQFRRELKANKEAWVAMENEKKKKWRAEQEARIKEATIRGMEPEVERIIRTSREEVKAAKEEAERRILQLREELAVDYETRTRRLRDQAFAECQGLIEQERKEALARQRLQYQELATVGEQEKAALRAQYERQLRELEDQRKKESDCYIQKLNRAHEGNFEEQRRVRSELEAKIKELQEQRQSVVLRERERASRQRDQLESRLRGQFSRELKEKLEKALARMAGERDEKLGVVIEKMARQKSEFEARLREEYDGRLREERKSREEAERRTSKEVLLMELRLKEHKDQLAQERGRREMAEDKVSTVLRTMEGKLDEEIRKAQAGLEDRMIEVRVRAGQEAELKFLSQVEELQRQVHELKRQRERDREEGQAREAEREKEAEQMEKDWCEQVEQLQRSFKKVIKKKDEELGLVRQELRSAAQKVRMYEGLLEKQRSDLMNTLR